MKNGLLLIALLLIVILLFVLMQFYRTRRTMAAFAGQHGLTYTKPQWNPLAIGTIEGDIGIAAFFMGPMSTKPTFGPASAAHNPDEKSIFMCLTVPDMPPQMIIRRRGQGLQGAAVESVLAATGYALVKTHDEDFDACCDVLGNPNEVSSWLTDPRRAALKLFLARSNCAVVAGRLQIEFTNTFIDSDGIESAFSHLRESQLRLDSAPFSQWKARQEG